MPKKGKKWIAPISLLEQVSEMSKRPSDEECRVVAERICNNYDYISDIEPGIKRDGIWKQMVLYLEESDYRDSALNCLEMEQDDNGSSFVHVVPNIYELTAIALVKQIQSKSTNKTAEKDIKFCRQLINSYEKRVKKIANRIVSGENLDIISQADINFRNAVVEKTMELFTDQKEFKKGINFLFRNYSENIWIFTFVSNWLKSLQESLKLDELELIIDVADKLCHRSPQSCSLILDKIVEKLRSSGGITEYNQGSVLKLLGVALKYVNLGFAAKVLSLKGWDPQQLSTLYDKHSRAALGVSEKNSGNTTVVQNCKYIETGLYAYPKKEPNHQAGGGGVGTADTLELEDNFTNDDDTKSDIGAHPVERSYKNKYKAVEKHINDKSTAEDTVEDLNLYAYAFRVVVNTQARKLKPDTAYMGVGARVRKVKGGFIINEIYSPDVKRFTIYGQEDFIDPQDLKNKIITHVKIGKEMRDVDVTTLSDLEVALAFHKEGNVVFGIKDVNTNSITTVSCESAIFIRDSESKSSKFSALNKMLKFKPKLAEILIRRVINSVLSVVESCIRKVSPPSTEPKPSRQYIGRKISPSVRIFQEDDQDQRASAIR